MKTNIILLCILLNFAAMQLIAGDRSNITGVGMGRTINAFSRGTDAIGINPANLAIPEKNMFTLSLVGTGLKISTELFTYDLYQKYFTGEPDATGKRIARHLTTEDKNIILEQLPKNPRTQMEVELQLFGISFQHPVIGGIGFAVTDHIGTSFALSQDFFRFAAFGLEPNGSIYTFNGTNLNAWWYRDYNLSYARKLPLKIPFLTSLSAGVGIKFIRGYGIQTTDYNRSSFGNYPDPLEPTQYSLRGNFDFLTTHAGADFMNEGSKASFSPMPDPVGKGTGFDVGVNAEFFNGILASVSVTDIGKITWDKNIIQSIGGGSINVTGVFGTMEDTLKDAVKGTTREGKSFTTNLPTRLRVGAMIDVQRIPFLKFIPGKMLLAIDYTQGFNESLGNTKKSRFSLGMEYRIIPMVPLRTGIAFGGDDKVRWGFGFGFDFRFVNLDFATDNFGILFSPKNFQMFSVSFGMKIKV